MLIQDIRYALRSLWHAKGFTIVAVLCLGFGIGVNTTIFSIIDGVLVKPFPYHDSERLVVVGLVSERADEFDDPTLSYLDLRDWREASTSFAGFGAEQGRSMTLVDGTGEPARYLGGAVSHDMFPVLGIAPALGRNFTAEEDSPAGGRAVIISDNIWRTRYQSDPGVLGKVVTVNAMPRVVVGVMPPRFQFPTNMELWIPIAPTASKEPRGARNSLVFGRLKPGIEVPRALEELRAISKRLKETYPDDHTDAAARISTLRQVFIPPDVKLILSLMMAGVTLVLFIACSNVANLLLARATARRRELSVRAALGAGRGRIVRQLLTESVVLALVSVPLGVGVALAGTRLIAAALPVDQVPYYITWQVDARALAYTLAIAAGTAVLFGLFPALQASGGVLHEQLKEGTRGNSVARSRLRSTLVVIQIALALIALVGSLLFVKSFRNLDGYRLGFDPKPLMTMRFYMPGETYEEKDAKARRVQDVLSRIESIPGVQAAFASNMVPISGGGDGGTVLVDGYPAEKGREPFIDFTGVTPHFLQTLGVGVQRGRNFTESETAAGVMTPVALVNEAMARKLWPRGDALGGRFKMIEKPNAPDWFTVVGIVPGIKQDGINPASDESPSIAYVSYNYQQTLSTGLTIRVARDPASITTEARAAIRASDPNLPVAVVRTMEEVRRLSFWEEELFGWIFGTIGIVGLILASVGVYGVMSYAVSQRTQEIGVRVALGAARSDVLKLVVGQGLALAGIGVGAGLVLGPLATSFARTQLYAVSPFDPLSFATVAIVLLTVAFVASYVPARRAMGVDPVVALRGE
jgi:putative ABC transport system permease protein